MTLAETEKLRGRRQSEIDASKSIESRRSFGQFATPPELADEIVEATLPYLAPRPVKMLEPAAGTGAFVSAFLRKAGQCVSGVTAIEIDRAFFEAGSRLWSPFPVIYRNADFTEMAPEARFGLVVANPPYVRHHGLDAERKRWLQKTVFSETGIAISGLAGLYCHFMLLSLKWMEEGAVGVWLIPAEWMSVNYGQALREFLSRNVRLLRVHRFDASDVRFSDALVSSSVVWFRKAPPGGSAEFTCGISLKRPETSESIPSVHLHSGVKWPPAEEDAPVPESPLRAFFSIRRGIATGDNAFFVVTEADAENRRLARDFLKPILPSPRHLATDHILADGQGVPVNAKRLFLFDCTGRTAGELPSSVRAYLAEGEKTTAGKKLCASRKNWFDQEQRSAAPILCSYMGRGNETGAPVRFILNESNAIATNSYLMLYPKAALAVHLQRHPEDLSRVWRFLKEIPAEAFRRAGRCYGGGLQKMEPSELGALDCSPLQEWLRRTAGFTYGEDGKGQLLLVMENSGAVSDPGKA